MFPFSPSLLKSNLWQIKESGSNWWSSQDQSSSWESTGARRMWPWGDPSWFILVIWSSAHKKADSTQPSVSAMGSMGHKWSENTIPVTTGLWDSQPICFSYRRDKRDSRSGGIRQRLKCGETPSNGQACHKTGLGQNPRIKEKLGEASDS